MSKFDAANCFCTFYLRELNNGGLDNSKCITKSEVAEGIVDQEN